MHIKKSVMVNNGAAVGFQNIKNGKNRVAVQIDLSFDAQSIHKVNYIYGLNTSYIAYKAK